MGEVFDFPPPTAERPTENGYYWVKLATDTIRSGPDGDASRQWISTGWSLIFHDASRGLRHCVMVIGDGGHYPWTDVSGPVDDWIIYEVGPKVTPPPPEN